MNQPRTITRHARKPQPQVALLSHGRVEMKLDLDEASQRLARVLGCDAASVRAVLVGGNRIKTAGYEYELIK